MAKSGANLTMSTSRIISFVLFSYSLSKPIAKISHSLNKNLAQTYTGIVSAQIQKQDYFEAFSRYSSINEVFERMLNIFDAIIAVHN